MANIKANQKSIRQTARRAEHNKSVRTRLKTLVKDFTAEAKQATASLVASARHSALDCVTKIAAAAARAGHSLPTGMLQSAQSCRSTPTVACCPMPMRVLSAG